MPTKTKTPTRKAKKPTLADRFKSLHLEIFDARGATVSHINSVNDRVTELFKLLECRLPKPTDPPPAEKRVPKVGDWVWNDARGIGKVLYPSGPHFAVTFPGHNGGWKAETGDEHCWYVGALNIRPATPEEIAENKRTEEWAKVDRLQDGDACVLSREEYAELVGELNALFGEEVLGAHWGSRGVAFFQGQICHSTSGDFQGMKVVNRIPRHEFLRRAKGTAARLKSEAEAKELAMPLEFGMRVKVTGSGGVAFSKDGSLTADGLWIGERDGLHLIGWSGPDGPGTWNCKRPEFTVIP